MDARAASARGAQAASLGADAPQLIEDLGKQLAAMQAAAGAAPSDAASAEIGKLTDAMKDLQTSMTQQQDALRSLEGLRGRIGNVNSGKEKMSPADLQALKTAADNFEKRLTQLDNAIAKTVADVKGVKFDTGERNKGNRGNRPGGRQA